MVFLVHFDRVEGGRRRSGVNANVSRNVACFRRHRRRGGATIPEDYEHLEWILAPLNALRPWQAKSAAQLRFIRSSVPNSNGRESK